MTGLGISRDGTRQGLKGAMKRLEILNRKDYSKGRI